MFVGRTKELDFLNSRYNSKKAELIVLYGRTTWIYKMTQMNFYEAIKFFPNYSFEDKIKEYANIQRGIYKLTDNFFKFWYAYVFPNVSTLELGDTKGVYDTYIKNSINHFCANSFENICIQYLNILNIKKELPFRFNKIGRWWDNKNEIDIFSTGEKKLILV